MAVGEPYPNWHLIWIDEIGEEWEVWCIVHGFISRCSRHFDAMVLGYEHDVETGGFNYGKGM